MIFPSTAELKINFFKNINYKIDEDIYKAGCLILEGSTGKLNETFSHNVQADSENYDFESTF